MLSTQPQLRVLARARCILSVAILSALGTTVTGIASAESRPVKPCVVNGPAVNDTLAYLNNGGGPQLSYEASTGKLIMSSEGPESSGRNVGKYGKGTYSAPILALNCETSAQELGDTSWFYLDCLEGQECFSHDWMYTDDNSTGHDQMFRISQHLQSNPDQADRYGRALSHLVYLLQQQYKQSHSNPNDPFAKPPQ